MTWLLEDGTFISDGRSRTFRLLPSEKSDIFYYPKKTKISFRENT